MKEELLSVREIQKDDIELLVNYWMTASAEYLAGMGADLEKLPTANQFTQRLLTQISDSYENKNSYALIWLIDNRAVGHSSVNKIVFGQEAYMHLHLWYPNNRKKGMGTTLVKKGLPIFFENLQLQQLFCEPYALNPAPNKTLAKVGFEFEKEYTTIPGTLNFEQPVKRWKLTKARFEEML